MILCGEFLWTICQTGYLLDNLQVLDIFAYGRFDLFRNKGREIQGENTKSN
jgi:hypothetical protein